ncbi:M50 family metallopeptidase [Microlunatus elymi]|uniref:M50 family metallopeptidase n=1 Tax=Microlunatus elymi TaxID=2596828 RepID=UPI001D18F713|nr:M50 family metallopeptidase [Microlunatus elymi]
MEVVTEIWQRATATQPPPHPQVVGVIAVIGMILVLYRRTWPVTRLLVTITHEGAHALAAMLAGRRLTAIHLNSDTSGLTVSHGKARGPGMIIMLTVGYLGPALAGLGAAALLAAGHSIGLLWLLVLLLSLMLLLIRNAYGILVLLVAGGSVFLISWYLDPVWQSAAAYLITWILLIAAPKPVIELIMQRRRGGDRSSDVAQLVTLTRIPGPIWSGLFLVCSLAGLALGTAVLLPSLIELFEPMFTG